MSPDTSGTHTDSGGRRRAAEIHRQLTSMNGLFDFEPARVANPEPYPAGSAPPLSVLYRITLRPRAVDMEYVYSALYDGPKGLGRRLKLTAPHNKTTRHAVHIRRARKKTGDPTDGAGPAVYFTTPTPASFAGLDVRLTIDNPDSDELMRVRAAGWGARLNLGTLTASREATTGRLNGLDWRSQAVRPEWKEAATSEWRATVLSHDGKQSEPTPWSRTQQVIIRPENLPSEKDAEIQIRIQERLRWARHPGIAEPTPTETYRTKGTTPATRPPALLSRGGRAGLADRPATRTRACEIPAGGPRTRGDGAPDAANPGAATFRPRT